MFRVIFSFLALLVSAAAFAALLPPPLQPAQSASRSALASRAERQTTGAVPAVSLLQMAQAGTPSVDATRNADTPVPQGGSVPPEIDAVLRATARLDINTATAAELDGIPGGGRIGRTIVRHRPYGSVEELLTRRVLRKSTYERIKDQVGAR